MTHTLVQKKKFASLTDHVCYLLQWSELEYAEYMQESGIEYLNHYIKGYDQDIDMLIRSKYFWAWWRTNWYQRDAQFVYHMVAGEPELFTDLYKELHDARTLAGCIYPNGIVLNYTYAEMIQVVIDKKGGTL